MKYFDDGCSGIILTPKIKSMSIGSVIRDAEAAGDIFVSEIFSDVDETNCSTELLRHLYQGWLPSDDSLNLDCYFKNGLVSDTIENIPVRGCGYVDFHPVGNIPGLFRGEDKNGMFRSEWKHDLVFIDAKNLMQLLPHSFNSVEVEHVSSGNLVVTDGSVHRKLFALEHHPESLDKFNSELVKFAKDIKKMEEFNEVCVVLEANAKKSINKSL